MNAYCNLTGVGLIPWSPLYRGHLARPASSTATTRSEADAAWAGVTEDDKAIVARVEEIAKKKGWPMAQVALAWIVHKGTIPIVGFSTIERMDEAIGVNGKELSEDEIRYLEELYKPKAVMGH